MSAMHDVYRRLDAVEQEIERARILERARFVGVRYVSTSGQSIANATVTVVNFGTGEDDPFSLVTNPTTNWTFTCPIAGRYAVTAQTIFTSTNAWALGEAANLGAYKNGALVGLLDRQDSMDSTITAMRRRMSGITYINAAKNDTLNVQIFQNSGGALALDTSAGYNHVAIWLIN